MDQNRFLSEKMAYLNFINQNKTTRGAKTVYNKKQYHKTEQ